MSFQRFSDQKIQISSNNYTTLSHHQFSRYLHKPIANVEITVRCFEYNDKKERGFGFRESIATYRFSYKRLTMNEALTIGNDIENTLAYYLKLFHEIS